MVENRKNGSAMPKKWILSWAAGVSLLLIAVAAGIGISKNTPDGTKESEAALAERRAIELSNGFEVTDLLFIATTNLAEERGLVYTRLREGAGITPAFRDKVLERRAASNQAFDQAIELVAASVSVPRRDRTLRAIKKQRTEFEQLRQDVDDWQPNAKNKAAIRLSSSWFAASSRLIAAAEDMLILVHHTLRSTDPTVDMSLKLQHLAWIMSEFAARERGLVSGAIAENTLSRRDDVWTRAAIMRRFNNAWHSARSIASFPDTPQEIRATMAAIERDFVRDLMKIRDDIEHSVQGQAPTPGLASLWFGKATDAIKPIVRLGRLAGEAARSRSLLPRAQVIGGFA